MNSPTFRLAWREVRQHRWRSLLVIVLIGLPVLLSVAIACIWASDSSATHIDRSLGSANASIEWVGGKVVQEADGVSTSESFQTLTREQAAARAATVSDRRIVPLDHAGTSLIVHKHAWSVVATVADFTDPLAASTVDVESGRLPRSDGEVLVTDYDRRRGVHIGDHVMLGGAALTVVGVGGDYWNGPAVLPSAAVVTAAMEWTPQVSDVVGGPYDWTFLLAGPTPTATEISRWNDAGFTVTTRHHSSLGHSTDNATQQLIAITVTSLVIEVVLLAGPAFAVGVRRQRHDLALLAVAGGDSGHLRRVVLWQALCLGVFASVVGAALGIAGARLTVAVLDGHWGSNFGPFQVPRIAALAAIVLGVAAAVGAALLPARHAARTDVTTALAGRQPSPKVIAGWPIIGALIFGVAVLGSVRAMSPRSWVGYAALGNSAMNGMSSDFANAWWGVGAVVGALLMTPWLISRVARLGRFLPLPLRLAVRESDRHRARTAPAIAAVMASVSAVTALGIASTTVTATTPVSRPSLMPGSVEVSSGQLGRTAVAIERATGAHLTPLPVVKDGSVVIDAGWPAGVEDTGIAVADAETLRAWGLDLSPHQQKALDRGSALAVAGVSNVGRVEVAMPDPAHVDEERLVQIPVSGEPLTFDPGTSGFAAVIISPATAARKAMATTSHRAVVDRPASKLDLDAIRVAAATVSPTSWSVSVSHAGRGHSASFWLTIVLAVAGAAAVLIGTFSATALTLADARADLRTLGEVGAAPRTRRLVAGSHALVIALLGAWLGVAVGVAPGIVSARLQTGRSGDLRVDVPWLLMALLLIALPLLAAAITAAVSRGPRPHPIREAV